MAKRSFGECFFHFEADASEMDKIDNTIRLVGLKFPTGKRVIGRKNADLIVALGAFDISRDCTGNQLLVVARLCILYEAILKTHNKHPYLDINSDFFYGQALKDISEGHPSISKYLSTSTLRQVIEIYLVAFHRSGLKKSIKPNANITDGAQDNNNGGEFFIGEHLVEPSESSVEHKSARIKLEKLVKDWMAVRAIARKRAKANRPKTAAPPYPEQQPGESNNVYVLGSQQASESYREEDISERPEYNDEPLMRQNERLKEVNETIKQQNELLKENKELHKSRFQMLEQHHADIDRLHEATVRRFDQRRELRRLASMTDDRRGNVNE